MWYCNDECKLLLVKILTIIRHIHPIPQISCLFYSDIILQIYQKSHAFQIKIIAMIMQTNYNHESVPLWYRKAVYFVGYYISVLILILIISFLITPEWNWIFQATKSIKNLFCNILWFNEYYWILNIYSLTWVYVFI